MPSISLKNLSPREEQIIDLCSQGFTNEGIAHELGLSIGTVNTYWLRIRMKIGGSGRTEIVSRVIRDRAQKALREKSLDPGQADRSLFDFQAALALLNLAMEGLGSAAWATDRDLTIRIIANGELPTNRYGVEWEAGKTVYEVFKTEDPKDPGVAAHLAALDGVRSSIRLRGEFSKMTLRVMPLRDESGEVLGCVSLLTSLSNMKKD